MDSGEVFKVLVGCSGSVAAIKLPVVISCIQEKIKQTKVHIKVIMTEHSQHFTNIPDNIASETVQYYTDQDEWKMWTSMGDDVLHIELGKWADVMIVAPMDANTLAKVANGICDNLLTCTIRAWDLTKPLAFALAMNTRMLEHPITKPQVEILKSWGYQEISTVAKRLACGETGYGAMAEVNTIVDKLAACLHDLRCSQMTIPK